MDRQERITRLEEIDIYPVTCQALSEGRTNLEVLEGVLAGGAKIVQLREKDWDKRALYEMGLKFRRRTTAANALFIVNDHVDVALAVGADGVHLGHRDLPIPSARAIAPGLIVGASSHNLEQALRAEKEGADYVNIGPIFVTKTKEGAENFLGPAAVRKIGARLSIPFTTMGGINRENIREVLRAGARRVAMITGITRAPDIEARVRELRHIIASYG